MPLAICQTDIYTHVCGCIRGSREDLVLWIDCDTDSRSRKGFGQAIVACALCDITIHNNGMITVSEEGNGKTRAI